MSDFSVDDYADLAQTGHAAYEPTSPEDEFFHSLYISGVTRKNEMGIDEQAGNLQIRGIKFNLQEAHMIIAHTKDVNVKEETQKGGKRSSIRCFSYKEGAPPHFGTTTLEDGSPRRCPPNAAERATVPFCEPCRNHLLVAGIYCQPDGKPIMDENGKPIFIFIRGKGMKYKNVSDYLSEMYKLDLDPMFTPQTDQSREFEKAVVNNKRFVTKITVGETGSQYGPKKVFILEKGQELSKDFTKDILQVSKKTLKKFNDKFDWSKSAAAKTQTTGYAKPEGVLNVDDPKPQTETKKSEPPKEPDSKPFSFDDVSFD